MKKLLLVGVVGLTALLVGCGGSSEDCDEGTVPLPPVPEVSFPNNQAPEYIVREGDEIGFARIENEEGINGQVVSLEFEEGSEYNYTIAVQQFDADYSEGYLTKPTANVFEYNNSPLVAVMGKSKERLTNYDLIKLQDVLMTVKQRGGFEDAFGTFYPSFDVYFPVMGELQDVTGDTVKINGIVYPKGTADDDVYIGRHVAGMYDGEKLNIFSLSFAGPAWGYTHIVTVYNVVGENSFSYVDSENNVMVVHLREKAYMEHSDRLLHTDGVVPGMKLMVSGARLDYNNLEALKADVYRIE